MSNFVSLRRWCIFLYAISLSLYLYLSISISISLYLYLSISLSLSHAIYAPFTNVMRVLLDHRWMDFCYGELNLGEKGKVARSPRLFLLFFLQIVPVVSSKKKFLLVRTSLHIVKNKVIARHPSSLVDRTPSRAPLIERHY